VHQPGLCECGSCSRRHTAVNVAACNEDQPTAACTSHTMSTSLLWRRVLGQRTGERLMTSGLRLTARKPATYRGNCFINVPSSQTKGQGSSLVVQIRSNRGMKRERGKNKSDETVFRECERSDQATWTASTGLNVTLSLVYSFRSVYKHADSVIFNYHFYD
jgi:hypothetical protein